MGKLCGRRWKSVIVGGKRRGVEESLFICNVASMALKFGPCLSGDDEKGIDKKWRTVDNPFRACFCLPLL